MRRSASGKRSRLTNSARSSTTQTSKSSSAANLPDRLADVPAADDHQPAARQERQIGDTRRGPHGRGRWPRAPALSRIDRRRVAVDDRPAQVCEQLPCGVEQVTAAGRQPARFAVEDDRLGEPRPVAGSGRAIRAK